MKKILLTILSVVLLCAFSFGLVFGITNFNKLKVGTDDSISQTEDTETVKKYKQEIESLNEDISKLNTQIEDLKNSTKTYTAKIEDLTTQKTNLETQIESLTTEKTQNEQKIASLNSQISTLNTQIETLEQSEEDKTTEISNLNETIKNLEDQKATLETTNENKDTQIATLNNKISTLNTQITNLTTESETLQTQISTLNANISKLQEKVDYYKGLLDGREFILLSKKFNQSINCSRVWYLDDNIYYSYSTIQYVYDKETKTWNKKTWNGLTNFEGDCVWTLGDKVYYSDNNKQYVLDKSTDTWSTMTWNGLTSFYGSCVWTDGENVYYSNGSSLQYVLDESTNTWNTKTWSSITNFYGGDTFEYKDTLYLVYSGYFYEFDKTTHEWVLSTTITIKICGTGFTNSVQGAFQIFIYNDNIYNMYGSNHIYKYDFENKGWYDLGYTYFINGGYHWTDGEKIYFSDDWDNSYEFVYIDYANN